MSDFAAVAFLLIVIFVPILISPKVSLDDEKGD
jgi:hypothetical protein